MCATNSATGSGSPDKSKFRNFEIQTSRLSFLCTLNLFIRFWFCKNHKNGKMSLFQSSIRCHKKRVNSNYWLERHIGATCSGLPGNGKFRNFEIRPSPLCLLATFDILGWFSCYQHHKNRKHVYFQESIWLLQNYYGC